MTKDKITNVRLNIDPAKGTKKGLVILNTGTGKGKTTAALGILFRAWGHDMKIIMLQFIKKPMSKYGEHKAAQRLGIEIIAGGAGFIYKGKNEEKGRALAVELWEKAREKINSGNYHIVILDELTYPLSYGWIPVPEVIDVLEKRPLSTHIIITGRNAPQELIDYSDLVTEMKQIKHPFDKGIKAQQGIEF
jgi:cob(I)alamin adenosyltransferase